MIDKLTIIYRTVNTPIYFSMELQTIQTDIKSMFRLEWKAFMNAKNRLMRANKLLM